ncbi:ABC transporter permease [Paramicrobacterium fandaimingii]|uniref:ABC transporter permease n=1 Tax=Paramicrobacterium fandaimingii TaxID=2708079 RepID=UPI001420A2B0|nr:ABC transporter permease [Microbacterium fandaimingii]
MTSVTRRPGWVRSLLRSPTGIFGLTSTTILVLCAILSLLWTPYDPVHTDVLAKWQPPSPQHLLGTDNIGRDIFSVLLAGSRVTLQVAIGSSIVAAIVGVVFATLGALTARWLREIVAVFIDILIAFPTLLIAMMLASAFGGSIMVVILAVGISFGVNIGRVSRPEIRRVSRSEYVTAGVAAGLGPVRNLTRHVLPNVAPVFIVQLSWCMAVAVLAEAGLSYLGYGAPVSTPSWGRVLAELQSYIGIHPLSVVWPGIAITVTVLGFNLLGDGLRDATDPRLGRPEVITA